MSSTLCTLCPKMCRFACPVADATADEGATPTAMMQAWKMAQDGDLSWSDAADSLSRCTGCEACRAPCEFDQDIPSYLYEARAEAWEQGAIPAGAKALHEAQLSSGTAFGIDARAVLKEHAGDGDFDKKGRVLYWPGCRQLAEAPTEVKATMALLRALGADHVSLPARDDVPGCCGAALRVIGDRRGFAATAAGLQQYMNRQRTVVTSDSGCIGALRDGFPEVGHDINAEVLHLGEYLLFFDERLKELGAQACAAWEASGEAWPTFVVHDACGLHRRQGRGQAVHAVVAAVTGTDPRTFGPSADRTACCGAGDFHDVRRPDAAKQVAAASIPNDLARGAWVITGDTTCRGALANAAPQRVFDLVGFLAEWLNPVLN
jgi:Fe-S oxidoreductase